MSTASRYREETAGSLVVDAPALEAIDEIIHQKARLGIMSTLIATGAADFKLLKETLGLSDGNLSTHLAMLEALVRSEPDRPVRHPYRRGSGRRSHEPFSGRGHLRKVYAEALRAGYLWHEFGDLHLIL